jgi:RNA polymerase sigma-70 factor, ECF subfamily
MPHLDAAYNLARWLVTNSHDAEDLVQEACLRAFKALGAYRGGDARSWLLTIVRNTCYTWLKANKSAALGTEFDEMIHQAENASPTSEEALVGEADRETLRQALESLPAEFREVVVLRELEGMSYKEIADALGVPMGTVMSRLARGRQWLRLRLEQSGK